MPDKSKGIYIAAEKYKHVATTFIKLTLERQLKDNSKKKFNGREVMFITQLEEKQLGEFIQYAKSKFLDSKRFHEFIASKTPSQVKSFIKEEFEKFKTEKPNPEQVIGIST